MTEESRKNAAYLRITTWKSIMGGLAHHYYGYIDFSNKRAGIEDVQVKRRLTRAEAKDMTKLEKLRGDNAIIWKEGDTSGAFLTETGLINAAKDMYLRDNYGTKILVIGQPYILSIQRIAYAPKKFTKQKNRINKLYAEAELNNWYEDDEKKMDDIDAEFAKLFEEMTR